MCRQETQYAPPPFITVPAAECSASFQCAVTQSTNPLLSDLPRLNIVQPQHRRVAVQNKQNLSLLLLHDCRSPPQVAVAVGWTLDIKIVM